MSLKRRADVPPVFVYGGILLEMKAIASAILKADIQMIRSLLKEKADFNYYSRDWAGFPLDFAISARHNRIAKLLIKHGAETYEQPALHLAARIGNEEIVKFLLNEHADTNIKREDGETPLNLAVWNKHSKIVDCLIKCGADVNFAHTSSKWKGQTALHLAVKKGSLDIVKLLLTSGAKVDARGKDGETPLHFAVQGEHIKIVQYLIKCGASVHSACTYSGMKGQTALHLAAENGNQELVKLLLTCGAKIDAKGEGGETPLHRAVWAEQIEVVKFLIICGASLHSRITTPIMKCQTALHLAALKQSKEIVLLLLANGVDIDVKSKDGITPLHCAAKSGHVKIANLLIKRGASINSSTSFGEGHTALYFAIIANSEEKVQLLLINGANANAKLDHGTLLHLAVVKKYIKIVDLLLKYGACVNAALTFSPYKGRTALHFAASRGSEEIVLLLLENGADINVRGIEGETPLHLAAKKRHSCIVQLLIKYGACVNTAYTSSLSEGRTALHFAASYGSESIVQLLLMNGADANVKGKEGETPLHLAAEHLYNNIVDLLIQYGACVDSTYSSKYGEGCTSLHLAADAGDESLVKLLLLYGANLKAKTAHGSDAFDIASWKKSTSFFFQKKYRNVLNVLSRCSNEIKLLKSNTISNSNVSFYNILTRSLNQIALYTRNRSICQVLSTGDYQKKFPLYASMIKSNFERGINRRNLLKQADEHFSHLDIFYKLPKTVSADILSYLSNTDLNSFIDACKVKYCT